MIKNTALECLRHLYPRLLEDNKNRKLFKNLVQVNTHTIKRWTDGLNMPLGESWIRLQVALDFMGYSVIEFENLPEPVRNVLRLIAFGVLTQNDVIAELGLSRSHAQRFLRGDLPPTPAVVATLSDLWDEYSSLLEECQEEYRSLMLVLNEPEAKVEITPGVKADRGRLIKTLAEQINAMLPNAVAANSNECTPEERRLLRRLTGEGYLFRLSNALAGLCGETAREIGIERSRR